MNIITGAFHTEYVFGVVDNPPAIPEGWRLCMAPESFAYALDHCGNILYLKTSGELVEKEDGDAQEERKMQKKQPIGGEARFRIIRRGAYFGPWQPTPAKAWKAYRAQRKHLRTWNTQKRKEIPQL